MAKLMKPLAAAFAVVLILVAGVTVEGNLAISRMEATPAHRGAPGKFVVVEGRNAHVLTLGDPKADPTGAPIMLIHGFAAAGLATWMPWAEKLHAAGRSIVMPDLLGFGHSERVTTPGDYYTVPGRAAQVLAVADALGVSIFDVVGESYGGSVTAALALSTPERLRKAVFMDAQVYPQEIPLAWLGQAPYLGRAFTWNVMTGGPYSYSALRCRTAGDCAWLDLSRRTGTVDAFYAMAASGRNDGQIHARIGEITVPSIVIWGSEDRIVPIANGDRLARELRSPLMIINGGGHTPYLEQPDKVADRVLGFLGSPKL
jgi:pimeloyl-ACP methyl ester carboxylesterase